MKVWWSERARTQALEIFEYIAQDRPATAGRILESFLSRTELLADMPEQGPIWGRGSRPDLRSIVHESYRIVYRVRPDEVTILSVRHTRRELDVGPRTG